VHLSKRIVQKMPDQDAIFSTRLQLLQNGYTPIPNHGKVPAMKGWNLRGYADQHILKSTKGTPQQRLASWVRRFPGAVSTGVRIEDGLAVFDFDVDDEAAIAFLFDWLTQNIPDVAARAPTRYGGGTHKLALFVKLNGEDFVRLGSRKYHRPDQTAKEYHHVEAFGGKPTRNGHCSRQFAIFGPRAYGDNDEVTSEYVWAEGVPTLLQVPLSDLPVISKAQVLMLLAAFETWVEAQGWVRIMEADPEGDGEGEDVFDIDPRLTRFDIFHGEQQVDYHELESLVHIRPDLRVSPTFIPGVTTDRLDRCSVMWSNRFQCPVVKDWKTNARHYPVQLDTPDIADFGEKLKQVLQKHHKLIADAPPRQATLDDFNAFLPTHSYVHMPTRELWPMTSIDSTLPPMQLFKADGTTVTKVDNRTKNKEAKPVFITASRWLDQNKPLEQMTWAPGEDEIIRDKLMSVGGWHSRPRTRALNLYRKPAPVHGDPRQAGPWVDHIRRLYHQDARHIVRWLAHRVQRPYEKINHALVLGGRPGIGKDTLLEPVKLAIGHTNMADITPKQLLETFNEFVQSVILRINEVRDLGEMSMVAFYNSTKTYCAAPPDVQRVNRKHIGAYYIPNVCSVVMTTNYRTNCLYLEADDRRHHIAWSNTRPESLSSDYLPKLWRWYDNGGYGHVASYLAMLDLTAFNPKAAPRKTVTFFDIVDACQVAEGGELADALAKLDSPDAVTLKQVRDVADHEFQTFLKDRKNRRALPHRFEQCGYVPVRNSSSKDGLWVVSGVRQAVYAREELTARDRLIAVQVMIQKQEADRQQRAEMLRRGIHTVDKNDDDEKPG
jgi:hypothetical protein